MQQPLSTDFKKIAFFSALCAFLSLIEYAFPKPIPFMRIGFANMSVMLSLYVLNFPQTLLLVLIKVLFAAIISGTLFSYVFLFSLCGSFMALFFMYGAKEIFRKHISFIGIGIAGSLGNNLAQIALSYAIIFKKSTSYIAPVLLISGLISAIVLGIFTEIFASKSDWYSKMKSDNLLKDYGFQFQNEATVQRKKFTWKSFFKQFAISLLLFISIVFFSILIPSGKVLYNIGSFNITKGALLLGVKRALILIVSVQLSKLIIPRKLVFKGKTGQFINLILLYFRMLSEGEQKKDAKQNLVSRLDSEFNKICFD